MPVRAAWLAAALFAMLTACATSPSPAGRRDLLDIVKPGAPRDEVLLRLGAPFASFEGERIMAWSIGEDAGGYLVESPAKGAGAPRSFARLELIIVFDANGRVEKHRLVEVHKPD